MKNFIKCREDAARGWGKICNRPRLVPMVFLFLVLVLFVSGCGKKTENIPTILRGEVAPEEEETPMTGVLKMVDTEEESFTIYSTEAKEDMTLHYTGGTFVYDRYDNNTVIGSLDIGEIVDIYYDTANNKAKKICVSKAAWEEQKVENITIDQTEKIMEMYRSKYRYADGIVIADGEDLVELIDINEQDELCVKGIEKQIYSITITKGHGYVRPSSYSDFVGGMLEIGYDVILPITKNMLIPVREGTYTLHMSNGELTGDKTIKVIRNKEITVDMSEFRAKRIKEGYVNFQIRPAGADLYINGSQVFYDEPVKLKYGKHKIMVTMTGYNTYNGTLDLHDKNPTITIDLADQVAKVGEEEEKATPTPAPQASQAPITTMPPEAVTGIGGSGTNVTENSEGTSSTSTQKTVDSNHTITITGPVGVEVYWNGEYKGTTPCSFPKEIGSNTVSLSADGYQTKSYTVDIANDSKDVSYSFANLIAN